MVDSTPRRQAYQYLDSGRSFQGSALLARGDVSHPRATEALDLLSSSAQDKLLCQPCSGIVQPCRRKDRDTQWLVGLLLRWYLLSLAGRFVNRFINVKC